MQSIGHDPREFIAKSSALPEPRASRFRSTGCGRPGADPGVADPPLGALRQLVHDRAQPFKWPGNNTLAV